MIAIFLFSNTLYPLDFHLDKPPFMQKTETSLPELNLVGLTCRTSLRDEMDPSTAHIPEMLQKYFATQSSVKISDRLTPGVTYCVYTNYESDYTGEYDYFVGEAVSSFKDVPENFSQLTIPAQHYVKITAGPGPMASNLYSGMARRNLGRFSSNFRRRAKLSR